MTLFDEEVYMFDDIYLCRHLFNDILFGGDILPFPF